MINFIGPPSLRIVNLQAYHDWNLVEGDVEVTDERTQLRAEIIATAKYNIPDIVFMLRVCIKHYIA